MIIKILITTHLVLMTFGLGAQILNLPAGAAGIGDSQNGNVGIGTNAPESLLEIHSGDLHMTEGAIKISGNMKGLLVDGTGNSYLRLAGHGSPRFQVVPVVSLRSGSMLVNGWGGVTNPGISVGTPLTTGDAFNVVNNVTLGTNGLPASEGVQLFTVKGNGLVGIGVINPITKLQLSDGDMLISRSTSSSSLHFRTDSNGNSYISNENDFMSNGSSGNTSLTIGSQTLLRFNLGSDGGSGTEMMRLNELGNLGIGTITPDERLTVNGAVHALEVKVDLGAGGPDYVFAKDYALPSLESIQSYINQYQHLPEVPSAKEMKENGLKLGEMNMLLLKKVEELTLYVLELKKTNDEQQKEIEELKNKK